MLKGVFEALDEKKEEEGIESMQKLLDALKPPGSGTELGGMFSLNASGNKMEV